MILIIGLGNPGKKYEKTRHNVGFLILNKFAEKNNFSEFKISKKNLAEIAEGFLNEKKIILVKPQTYMNNSGNAIKKITSNIKHEMLNIWVVQDDIDLPLGKIKIVKNRGSAGHKGIESIIKELKTKDFIRFRVGIKQTNNEQQIKNNIEKFVLQKFNKEEESIIKKIIKKTIKAIETAIDQGTEKTMNEFNK